MLRLFRGLFGFEWAVYHGAPSRGRVWDPETSELARASLLVLAYFAVTGWAIRKGTASLKLINLNAAAQALLMAVLVHTELRYYALPRSVLWLTAALGLLAAFPRRGGGSSSAPPTA